MAKQISDDIRLVYGVELTEEEFSKLEYRPENAHLDENDNYCGVVEEPSWGLSEDFVQTPIPKSYKKVSTPEDVEAEIEEKGEDAEIAVTTKEAVEEGLSGKTVKNIIVEPENNEKLVIDKNNTQLNAIDGITVDGVTIEGTYTKNVDAHPHIQFNTPEVTIKNITDDENNTVYNVFEQKIGDTRLNKLTATNVKIKNPGLQHNVFSVYNFNAGAEITIRNCYFNLDANNSNVLRLTNYDNADGVKVTFENVNWNYINTDDDFDWKYAGLVLYQAHGSDAAVSGDLSHLKTWIFTFKNCTYNGELINAENYNTCKQVMYLYNINGSGSVNPEAEEYGIELHFE